MFKAGLSIFITLFSISMYAQGIVKNELDAYLSFLEQNQHFMGSVAVSRNGELLYSRTVGYADVQGLMKSDDETVFRIGSVTKMFTSVLILKAIEEKKLEMDQPIDIYFPLIRNADRITISDLLYHRSGIRDFTAVGDYMKWYQDPKSKQDMTGLISGLESDFEPDARSAYSNSNYVLLAYILEAVYDTSYAALLKRYITEPMGLSHTRFGGKINAGNNECYSYRLDADKKWLQEPETDLSIPYGAGGIVSTAKDLVHFSTALFNGQLLELSSVKQMMTFKGDYGSGIMKIRFNTKTGVGHIGIIDAFNTSLYYFEEEKVVFALTSNARTSYEHSIARAALSLAYGLPYDIPDME